MSQVTLGTASTAYPTFCPPVASWQLPSCQVSLVAQETLKGVVRTPTAVYDVDVEAPFSSFQIFPSIQNDFYIRMIQSSGIPIRIVLCPKGLGGGKFYSQAPSFLQPPLSSLSRDPKTPEELVSVLQQLPQGDSRLSRYLGFASQFIKTFASNPTLMKDQIDGLVTLVLSENQDITHSVINQLTGRIRNNTLLNLDLVHGLADAIDRASPAHLNADDLIQIMCVIVERIARTHTKGAEQSQEDQLKALSRVLNAMVDANVCDLSREKQEVIKNLLNKFSDSDSSGVRCFAAYAKEALTRIPNDETKLAAFFRVSVGLAKGVYYFYAAVNKLDPGKLVDGFFALQESAQGILNFAKQIKESFSEALPDLKGSLTSLQEGSSLKLRKLAWYDQLRYIEMLIASNSFQALEALLFNPRLQKEPIFFYALVERLHHVAISHPNLTIRTETLRLFQNLYQDDKTWNELTFKEKHFKNKGPTKSKITNRDSLRIWMGIKASIVTHLASYQQIPELQGPASEILGLVIQRAKGEELAFISTLRDSAPKISSPTASHTPLFAPKPKEQFALENKLEKARAIVTEDPGFKEEKPLYVPLMGTHYAGSDSTFDLFEEVQKFLKGDQKILLMLGASGSGKTFFSQILAEQLWGKYQPENGTIPFYISLPTIKEPGQKLIQQALKRFGFSVEEIAKLKESREIIWILDSYDEIPANTDLLERNELLDFKGKIIVTCRQEALPSIDLFIPTIGGKPRRSLLKEIYFAPFNSSQMDHFIGKYIQRGETTWKTIPQYRQKIDEIPGLFQLVQNPFILKIIVDILPEIIERHKNAPPGTKLDITRYSLYDVFVDEWFQKGFTRAKKQFTKLEVVGLRPGNLIKEAMAFCIQLANRLQTQGLTHIQYDIDTPDPLWDTWLSDHPKATQLRSMSPLKVTGTGDYSFLHKSLLEYFIAEGVKTSLIQKELSLETPSKENTFHVKVIPIFNALLEPSVWFFLADIAKTNPTFKQKLWDLIEQSKTDPQMALAAANAASIWNLANFSFSRKDLRGALLPGACLEKANLVGTDLRNTDLTKATLTGATLSYALLDGAKMEGVEWGQWPFIQAKDSINSLISSSNGKQLIGGIGETICIWEAQSRKLLKTLEGHTGAINTLLLLEGGKKLASGSTDTTIRIWNLESGQTVQTLKGHMHPVSSLTLLEGGKKLASGESLERNWDNIIHIWDLENGKTLETLMWFMKEIIILPLLERGKRLVFGSCGSVINIRDLESDKVVKSFAGHTDSVYALTLLEGGKKFASGSRDKTIRIWDFGSAETLKTLEGHTGAIKTLLLLEGGKKLASGSTDTTIRIWDLESGTTVQTLEGHTNAVNALMLLDGNKRLASGSTDTTIRIWDLEKNKTFKKLESHANRINVLTLLEGGKKLASGSNDKTIRIWDLESGTTVQTLEGHTNSVNALTPLEGGKRLAANENDGYFNNLRTWDLESSKMVYATWNGMGTSVVAFVEGGKKLVLGGERGTISIWDSESNETLKTLEGHTGAINVLLLLEGGKRLASGSHDKTIRIWDLESGKTLKTLEGNTGPVNALIPLEGGKRIASGSHDKTIRIWDLESGKTVQILEGHTNFVNVLTPLQGGKKLASGSWDSTIHIWDLESGKTLCIIKCPFHIASITSKEPNLLIVGDGRGKLWCWRLNFLEKDLQPELLWSTNSALTCSETQLGNPIGLSEPAQRLLLQHGAIAEKQ